MVPKRLLDPQRAVAYVRVSTTDQELGSEAQLQAIRDWCEREGVELVGTFEDRLSGATPIDKRPALLEAIQALADENAGLLVAMKRDRLARDVVITAMIERLVQRSGAEVVTADGVGAGSGPEAGLMRRILDSFAEYERALIGARTKAALAVKRARGEKTGGDAPYGFRGAADKMLRPVKKEQRVILRILSLHDNGHSMRSIAEVLNAESVQARGGRWHHNTIYRIIKREAADP